MSSGQYLFYLFVDEPGGFFAVLFGTVSRRHQERGSPGPFERDEAELFTHAELGDHRSGNLGRSLKIVLSAGRYVAEDNLFRYSPSQKDTDPRQQFRARHEIAI